MCDVPTNQAIAACEGATSDNLGESAVERTTDPKRHSSSFTIGKMVAVDADLVALVYGEPQSELGPSVADSLSSLCVRSRSLRRSSHP